MIHRSGYRPRSTALLRPPANLTTGREFEDTPASPVLEQMNPGGLTFARKDGFVLRVIRALVRPAGDLYTIVPAPAGRSMMIDTAPAALDLGPPPIVVRRQSNPGIAAPAGATQHADLGFPGDGSLQHVAHYPSYTRPAGKVAMGPKSVDNQVTVPALFVGAPQ